MSEFDLMLEDLLDELGEAAEREVAAADLGNILIALGEGLKVGRLTAKKRFYDACVEVSPKLEPLVRRHIAPEEA